MIKFSFIKDSLLYTIGNALPMAASIILLPFYANYLNATHYVALSFYIGISLLFQIIFSFSFEQYYGVIYTEIKHDENKVKILNGSILIYLLLYGSVIIFLTSLFGEPILKNIFQNKIPVSLYPFGILSVITGFLNAIFKVMMSTYIYSQKPKIFFVSNLINFFTTVIISLGGLFLFPDSLMGPIYGRFLSGVIIVLVNYLVLKKIIVWKMDKQYIKEFIAKSWGLFAYTLTLWIAGNIDRYFLKNYIDVNLLAGYDLIMKCFIGIEFIQNGLSMAIISNVFDVWKKEERVSFTEKSNRYFNVFILVITIVIALFVLLLPYFIQLIIGNVDYYSSFKYIGIIGVGYILRTLTYPYYFAFLYSKNTDKVFIFNGIVTLIQIILSMIFISKYGLIAAILISVITKIILLVLYHINIKKWVYEVKINYLKWFGITGFSSAFYLLIFYFRLQNNVWNLLLFFLLGIIVLMVYRNELRELRKRYGKLSN